MRKARRDLQEDVYSNSARRSRTARIDTLKALGDAIDPVGLLPLSVDMLFGVAAALKAGGYRSGPAYLYLAKQFHIQHGNSWTPDLELCLHDAARSVRRGLAPCKLANSFGLEKLASISTSTVAVTDGGPLAILETGICMALWMWHGIEAASILAEQASIEPGVAAHVSLGPTKVDPAGAQALRKLIWACPTTEATSATCMRPDDEFCGLCPVLAISRAMAARTQAGFSPKYQLFPQRSGEATSAIGVREAFSELLETPISEHSFRRKGSSFTLGWA